MFPVLEDDNGVTNDYIIMIETKKLDPGILKLKLTAHYDDDHASYLEDNNRTEVVCKTTNYNIIKTI